MEKKTKKKSVAKKLIPATSMLLVSATMLASSTYAWFTMSKDVEVKNISMTATVPEDIQLSLGTITGHSETTSLAMNTGYLTDSNGATAPTDPFDWSNIADISHYYSFGKLIPASSNNGLNIFYTPDASGVGRTMKEGARYYQAAAGKTQYKPGGTTEFTVGTDTIANSTAATAHINSSSAWTATGATAWNTTNDDGYYVDIPIWLRTSSSNDQTIYVYGFACDKTEEINATTDDADADDLYKAVRVAILSATTSGDPAVESYAVDGGCLALADGSDTLVDDTVAARNSKYPATQGANSILDSDNYSATGTNNKSGITGLTGRMTTPDGKVYGMSAATPTLTEITQNKGATSVATLTGTSTAGEFGEPVKLIIRVWLEGEDGNCWNENAGQDWQICLKFTKDALGTGA